MRKIINQYIDNWCHEGRILGFTECRGLGFNLALQCLAGFDCNTEIASELSGKYEEMIYNMFSLPYEIPGLGLHKVSTLLLNIVLYVQYEILMSL